MEKITYSATELAALLGISRYAAYNLMHRADFPSFRIGKRLLVTHADTLAWLNKQPHEEDPRPPSGTRWSYGLMDLPPHTYENRRFSK